MKPSDEARLDAIYSAIARIARRQDELERRLASLEGSEPVPSQAEPAAVPPVPDVGESVPDLPPFSAEPAPISAGAASREPGALETAFGLTWVSRIAVITAVLALAFFFQYAFERRWITETGRVLLGAGCGLLAASLGERFWRVRQTVYGQALTAAGIAFLYLSVWAAFGPYRLIPYAAAFGFMALITAVAGLLSFRYNSAAVAALGSAGGYLTPLLLGGRQESWFVLAYALLLGAGVVFVARRGNWRWLETLALAGTVALYIDRIPARSDERWTYSMFVLGYYGLFASSRYFEVFLTAQLLAGMTLAGLWAPASGALWGAWGLAACGLVLSEQRRWRAGGAAFASFWLAYGVWRTQEPMPGGVFSGAALAASYLLFLAWPIWAGKRGHLATPLDLGMAALNAGFFFSAGYWWLGPNANWPAGFAILMAAMQAGAARVLWPYDVRGAQMAAGAAWVLLTAAAPIQFAGYGVTVAWSMEAAALTWIGSRLRQTRAFYAAAAVFALVCLRLAFVDSRAYPSANAYAALVNERFLCFAAAAAGFWAAGWWVRAGKPALAAFLAGHGVLLWGISLEAAGWAARVAAPENVRSVASASISVLAGAYAVALVAGGATRRHAPSRLLGICLIGAVVVKLYLYDIWLLGAFYRMAAFAILGVLLWVMAYLYSRFRASIESWWRRP